MSLYILDTNQVEEVLLHGFKLYFLLEYFFFVLVITRIILVLYQDNSLFKLIQTSLSRDEEMMKQKFYFGNCRKSSWN